MSPERAGIAALVAGIMTAELGLAPAFGGNRAFLEAQKRPPFDINSPTGLVTDEKEKAEQRRAAADLHERIMHAYRKGAAGFTIAPGQYRFPNMRRLRFEGLKDFVIHGQGVTLWFERAMKDVAANPPGLEFFECRNVALKGASVDFDPPLYIQAKITGVSHREGFFEVEVDDGFPVVAMPPRRDRHGRIAGGQMIAYRASGEFIPQRVLRHLGVTALGGRRLKVDFPKAIRNVVQGCHDEALADAWGRRNLIRIGDYLAIIFRRGRAIHIDRCEGMLLEDLTLYASPGMGILETGGEGGNTYRRVRLIRRPGTKRLHAGMADGFHSALVARGPTIEDCEFSFNSDDMINLHGFFTLVCHRYSPRELVVRAMRYVPYRVGGKIVFYDFKSVEPKGEAVITKVNPLEDAGLVSKAKALPGKMGILNYRGDPFVIGLDRDVEADEGSMADTFNCNAPGFIIRGCYFHDTMGRSLLLNGASDGIVQNNVYERISGGIRVYMESWFYMEGPFPHNIRISNNRLTDIGSPGPVSPDQPAQGAIYVGMVPKRNYLRKAKPLANIEITGNIIERPAGQAIIVSYTRGARVCDNKIVQPHHKTGRLGYDVGSRYYGKSLRSAVHITVSDDVDVRNNTVVDTGGYCTDGPVDVGVMTENVTVEGPAER